MLLSSNLVLPPRPKRQHDGVSVDPQSGGLPAGDGPQIKRQRGVTSALLGSGADDLNLGGIAQSVVFANSAIASAEPVGSTIRSFASSSAEDGGAFQAILAWPGVAENIASFLTARDLAVSRGVCKDWRSGFAGGGLFKSVRRLSFGEIHSIGNSMMPPPGTMSFIASLDLSDYVHAFSPLRGTPTRGGAGSDGGSWIDRDKFLYDFLGSKQACARLRKLAVNAQVPIHMTRGLVAHCGGLTHLSLSDLESTATDALLDKAASRELRVFIAKQARKFTPAALLGFASRTPHMQAVGLGGTAVLTDESLVSLASAWPGLQKLELGFNAAGMTVGGLAALVERLPGLTQLSVRGCVKASESEWRALLLSIATGAPYAQLLGELFSPAEGAAAAVAAAATALPASPAGGSPGRPTAAASASVSPPAARRREPQGPCGLRVLQLQSAIGLGEAAVAEFLTAIGWPEASAAITSAYGGSVDGGATVSSDSEECGGDDPMDGASVPASQESSSGFSVSSVLPHTAAAALAGFPHASRRPFSLVLAHESEVVQSQDLRAVMQAAGSATR